MKKLVIITVFLSSSVFAQVDFTKPVYKKGHTFDASLSGGESRIQGALSWSHLHGFGKKTQKFKVGYGIRYSSFFGGNLFYTTAPAKYTSDNAKIDTLSLLNAQVNTLNVSVHLQYTVLKKLDLGFNIDAIGLTLGAEQKYSLLSSTGDPANLQVNTAKPSPFNLLLIGDNDKGSLISEFYVRYWLSPKWAIKGGFNYFFSEYTTNAPLSFNNGDVVNDRYRNKSYMGFLSLSFKPFNN
jgi:hypothetical protein